MRNRVIQKYRALLRSVWETERVYRFSVPALQPAFDSSIFKSNQGIQNYFFCFSQLKDSDHEVNSEETPKLINDESNSNSENSLPSHYKIITFADGSLYKGEVHNETMHGDGILLFANGSRYEGHFESDTWNGKGKLRTVSGSVYEGDFRDNFRHGYGSIQFSDGANYEGQWKNDLMSGKGAYTFTDGTIYEGDFKNGLKEGQGRIIYPNGDLYEGEFKNDKMNGKGRLRTQNVYFEGFFKDDEIEGDVTLIDEEGKEHKGQLGNK